MISLFKKTPKLTSNFPKDFIDIHSHLLPGIDDGAKTLEDSVHLIKRLQGYGIENFICTPHVIEGVWENSSDFIKFKLETLKKHLSDEGITNINIRTAAEYLLDNNFDQLLKNGDLLTIKDNYILIEISYFNPPINLHKIIFDIQIAGYRPILAHPERYSYFHHKFEEYEKLKNIGCKFQLNLLSLSNYYGKNVQSIAFKLIEENIIDFVGTDTHNNLHLDYLEKIGKKKVLEQIAPILENNKLLL